MRYRTNAVETRQFGLSSPTETGRRALLVAAVFVGSLLAIATRRMDAWTNPQFWAEDGPLWYGEAHYAGALEPLFRPAAGFQRLLSRLGGAVAVQFPLSAGPLVFNIVGVIIQALPVVILFTRRFDAVIRSYWVRILIAVLYLGVPHSYEVHVNLNNAESHLALAAFMVLIASPPTGRIWPIVDAALLLLAGLSGPYGLVLLVIAFLRWRATNHRWLLGASLLLLMTSIVQVATFFFIQGTFDREESALGASPTRFVKIVGGNILASALLSGKRYSFAYGSMSEPFLTVFLWSLTLTAGSLLVYAIRLGPSSVRLLLLFATLLFAGGLVKPVTGSPEQWEALSLPGVGDRYYVIPILTWTIVCAWLSLSPTVASMTIRVVGRTLLAGTLLLALPGDWTHPPFQDLDYERYARRYGELPPGGALRVPLNPFPWSMVLRKPDEE